MFAKGQFLFELLLDVAGKNLVLFQAFDDFLVERGKFADLVLQDFFYVILPEIAKIVETDEPFVVQAGRCLLDELEKRRPNQLRHHSTVRRFCFLADLTDQRCGCSSVHRNFAAELSCCSATCRCRLESTTRSPKILRWKKRKSLSSICTSRSITKPKTAAKHGFRGWRLAPRFSLSWPRSPDCFPDNT